MKKNLVTELTQSHKGKGKSRIVGQVKIYGLLSTLSLFFLIHSSISRYIRDYNFHSPEVSSNLCEGSNHIKKRDPSFSPTGDECKTI